MKVIVTGAGGQLGWELARTIPSDTDFAIDAVFLSRSQLDIADEKSVEKAFNEHKPDVIINAAAYTAVDKAETDESNAFSINRDGPKNLAVACKKHGCYLLHVSTDFVFDGSGSRPIKPDAKPMPASVYGASKLAGENAIAAELESTSWCVIRTAWVYSSHGGNFVKSMLRFMAEKPALGIVDDQVGTPTWAKTLAEVCWQAAVQKLLGIYHWTDAGAASWYDFAVVIQAKAMAKGLLGNAIPINPIATEAYPLPARRPSYSVLDKRPTLDALTSIEISHWQNQLSQMLDELLAES